MSFSPLALFDRIVPKDRTSHRVAEGVPYGRDARQRLDVYAPLAAGGDGALPVLMFVYGGSWSDGDKSHYRFAGRAFAAQGFLTVIADYRLVPDVAYPAFIADVAKALSFVHDRARDYGGDPERIVLAGHSAGAYNAVMALAEPRYLPAPVRRAVRGFAGISGPYDFYPFDVPITQSVFGHLDTPQDSQPVVLVGSDMPPVWLGHGTGDKLVYLRNTVALAKILRHKGVAVTERHFEGLGHPDTLLALARPLRWRAPVLDEIAAFAHGVTATPTPAGARAVAPA